MYEEYCHSLEENCGIKDEILLEKLPKPQTFLIIEGLDIF